MPSTAGFVPAEDGVARIVENVRAQESYRSLLLHPCADGISLSAMAVRIGERAATGRQRDTSLPNLIQCGSSAGAAAAPTKSAEFDEYTWKGDHQHAISQPEPARAL
jgi:hypothetical protein